MKTILLGTALLLSTSSIALANESWRGTGEMYNSQRQLESTYDISVETVDTSETTESVTVEVKVGDQVVYADVCELTKAQNKWRKDCKESHGGGYKFANGLSQEYVELKNGHAYATTMVKDSETKLRILRTELDGNNAVRFFSETLENVAK